MAGCTGATTGRGTGGGGAWRAMFSLGAATPRVMMVISRSPFARGSGLIARWW